MNASFASANEPHVPEAGDESARGSTSLGVPHFSSSSLSAFFLIHPRAKLTDYDCSLVSSPVDPFFDPVTSSDRRRCGGKLSSPSPPAKQQQQQRQHFGADAVIDMLAAKRPLPPRGRFLQSVMEAGPLLQNLLVAGPLPRWRNPPPVHALDALPAGGVYVGATPLHAAAAMGYGPNANACMKRPMPNMAMAAANCSPGFVAKRHRLH
jgi:hypothetical protein